MIDIRRLRVLRAVDHHGTVSAAAETLHLTPSAVSQQIRQLSRELDVELLRPEGRRVRLTPAAHILLDHANALHARWERARADLATHAGDDAGPLRMHGYATGMAALLAPAAARLRETHPRLRVSVTQAEPAECFDLLLAGHTDLCLVLAGTGPPLDDARFEQRPILDEPQDLLVPAGHPLATRGSVRLSEAARESWISFDPGACDHARLTLTSCAAAGFTPSVVHRAADWLPITALVASGLGVSLLPRLVPIPGGQAVVRLRLHGEVIPSRRILTCVRGGSGQHPAIRGGLNALEEVAEKLSQAGDEVGTVV